MDSPYNWVVALHVAGAFAFVLAHGASAAVGLRLRGEREVPRVQALLDLSRVSTVGTYVGLVILLIGEIVAAFMAGLWGRGWIWTAIAILAAMIVFMYFRASSHFADLRRAAGQPYFDVGTRKPTPAEPMWRAVSRPLREWGGPGLRSAKVGNDRQHGQNHQARHREQ